MIILTFIVAGGVALFAFDIYPADKVSILILACLVLAGLIRPEQAVAGFGNPATITVACMLALSHGIQRTGGLNFAARKIVDLAGRSERKVLLAIIVSVGVLSAFINNTAAVALFLPLTIAVARQQDLDVSKLLMPMSFAAIFAGTCTLIGTSTNLLVHSVVLRHMDWDIGMFEFTAMGSILFLVGVLYLMFPGRRLLPSRRAAGSLTDQYRLRPFVTDLMVGQGSELIGMTVPESKLGEEFNVEVVEIIRGNTRLLTTSDVARIREGDNLLVSADPQTLIRLQREKGLTLKALKKHEATELEDSGIALVEAWISPNSSLVESTLKEIDFRRTFKATALAIRSHGRTIREKIGNFRLEYGDSLLILIDRDKLEPLRRSPDFLVFEEVAPFVNRDKVYWALGIFAALVATAALNVLSILDAAILAVAAMVLTGCLRLHELYSSISWQTIVMLGCLIPLGAAMENTGLAETVAKELVSVLQGLGPRAVLSGLYLLTSLLTAIMSNNATAVVMIPICLSIATQLGVSPKPFVFAVMFAASASFMTPVGYQTNIFIFGPGGYRFSDFLRVGTPLNLIFWLLATLLLPLFWPFQ